MLTLWNRICFEWQKLAFFHSSLGLLVSSTYLKNNQNAEVELWSDVKVPKIWIVNNLHETVNILSNWTFFSIQCILELLWTVFECKNGMQTIHDSSLSCIPQLLQLNGFESRSNITSYKNKKKPISIIIESSHFFFKRNSFNWIAGLFPWTHT